MTTVEELVGPISLLAPGAAKQPRRFRQCRRLQSALARALGLGTLNPNPQLFMIRDPKST